MSGSLRLHSILAFAAGMTAAIPCVAAEGPGDGVYGRADTDFTLELGVGAGVLRNGGENEFTSVYDLRFLLVDAAGLTTSGTYGPDAGGFFFVGAALRPLWPLLPWTGSDFRREFWDLLVQSIALEFGAAIGPFGPERGVGFGVGVSVDIPILVPSTFAQGMYLHLAARHAIFDSDHQGGPDATLRAWTLYAILSIKVGVNFGLSAWEPIRYRLP